MKLDAKTLTAAGMVLTALAGGVELRVQVGLLAAKVDRIEAELRRADLAYSGPEQPMSSDSAATTRGPGSPQGPRLGTPRQASVSRTRAVLLANASAEDAE
jgi:hypothetical protein